MKFSFMTFSCPELSWAEVVEAARRFGYEGVEPRAQAGHRHGIEPEASASARAAARKAAEDAGVEIACLATSCRYVLADPGERAAMVEESRRLGEALQRETEEVIARFRTALEQRLQQIDQLPLPVVDRERPAPLGV